MDVLATIEMASVDNFWLFIFVGSLSALIFGMGKVGFGGGVGILAVPVMIHACGGDAITAAGIMLPLLIAADYIGMASWWEQWDWRCVVQLLPGICVGIAAGGLVLWKFASLGKGTGGTAMMLGVGVIALGFVVIRLLQWRTHRQWVLQPVLWQASLAGVFIGLTSTLAHAAGPVASMYLLSQNMPKKRFVATTVILFWAVNQIKLIPYGALGMINTSSLWAGLFLVPAVLVGAFGGKWLNNRIGQRKFTGIIYILLAAAGVHMIIKASLKLWF